jgi:hypothetical protein
MQALQGSFSTAGRAAVFAKGGKVGQKYWPKDAQKYDQRMLKIDTVYFSDPLCAYQHAYIHQ